MIPFSVDFFSSNGKLEELSEYAITAIANTPTPISQMRRDLGAWQMIFEPQGARLDGLQPIFVMNFVLISPQGWVSENDSMSEPWSAEMLLMSLRFFLYFYFFFLYFSVLFWKLSVRIMLINFFHSNFFRAWYTATTSLSCRIQPGITECSGGDRPDDNIIADFKRVYEISK